MALRVKELPFAVYWPLPRLSAFSVNYIGFYLVFWTGHVYAIGFYLVFQRWGF